MEGNKWNANEKVTCKYKCTDYSFEEDKNFMFGKKIIIGKCKLEKVFMHVAAALY